MTDAQIKPIFNTAQQVAARLGHISPETLLRGVRDGRFPSRKSGRRVYFTERDIDTIVEILAVPVASPVPQRRRGATYQPRQSKTSSAKDEPPRKRTAAG